MSKPVILGLDAYRIKATGSAGHRLWRVLQIDSPKLDFVEYLKCFDWHLSVPDYRLAGRTVIALGIEGRNRLHLKDHGPCELVRTHGKSMILGAWIPHPSGRNRWYNDPENRESVSQFLNSLIRQEREHGL